MSQALKRIHHVEFVVGNAKQAAFFYRNGFGFDQVAYRGPETGCPDLVSYVLKQGDIFFVLSTPLRHDDPLSTWLTLHGDGVRDVAFEVTDMEATYGRAVNGGAVSHASPTTLKDDQGQVECAVIKAYGEVLHSFVRRDGYPGFLPGYELKHVPGQAVGIYCIDHVVANVSDQQMDKWVKWYDDTLGLSRFVSYDDKDISTEFTALRSTVVASPDLNIKFPINEPADGRKKSQIQEYIEANLAPGVQHVALKTDNILETIAQLRANGIDFLPVPDGYYETVWDRVGEVAEARDDIRKMGVLVDHDEQGYLLQLFTRPLQDRPTFFIEIIQRAGSESFGKGNFKALFETIEQEQGLRGNL